jgi:hypothetical protein
VKGDVYEKMFEQDVWEDWYEADECISEKLWQIIEEEILDCRLEAGRGVRWRIYIIPELTRIR